MKTIKEIAKYLREAQSATVPLHDGHPDYPAAYGKLRAACYIAASYLDPLDTSEFKEST